MTNTNAQETLGPWVTYTEAQQHARIGRTKLTELVTSGAVPAARVGRSVRINRSGLDEYLRRNAYIGPSAE